MQNSEHKKYNHHWFLGHTTPLPFAEDIGMGHKQAFVPKTWAKF